MLWRLSRAAHKAAAVAESAKNTTKQKKLLYESEDWAKKTIELQETNANGHAWLAFTMGKISDFVGTKERIERGKEIEKHLNRAIELDPSEPGLFYTFGRWCMEVAKLSWMERKLAATLFSKPPEATYSDAIEKFKKASELKEDWRANYFWMAKSHIAMKDYKKAIECLDLGIKCPPQDEEDLIIESELTILQKKYASYR